MIVREFDPSDYQTIRILSYKLLFTCAYVLPSDGDLVTRAEKLLFRITILLLQFARIAHIPDTGYTPE
jgi:hypothetical protein